MHPIIVCIFATTSASATPGAERSDATSAERGDGESGKRTKDALPTTSGFGNSIVNYKSSLLYFSLLSIRGIIVYSLLSIIVNYIIVLNASHYAYRLPDIDRRITITPNLITTAIMFTSTTTTHEIAHFTSDITPFKYECDTDIVYSEGTFSLATTTCSLVDESTPVGKIVDEYLLNYYCSNKREINIDNYYNEDIDNLPDDITEDIDLS